MSQDGLHGLRPGRSRCSAGLVAAYERAILLTSSQVESPLMEESSNALLLRKHEVIPHAWSYCVDCEELVQEKIDPIAMVAVRLFDVAHMLAFV
jgi:hypothetical protein